MKTPVILRVFRGHQLKEVKQFDLDQIVIGQESDAQLVLADEAVSPIHCLIELRDTGYYICDLGSKTGTFKNGAQVLDEPLVAGDEIGIGPFKLSFFVGVPKPTGLPKAAAVTPAVKIPAQKPSAQDFSVTQLKKADPDATVVLQKTSTPEVKKASAPKPKIESRPVAQSTRKKKKISFAPQSSIHDLKDVLKPTKGSVLEVIVAWRERVLTTYHFKQKAVIRVGSTSNEQVSLPSDGLPKGWPLVELAQAAKINVHPSAQCEVINSHGSQSIENLKSVGKCVKTAQANQVRLDQSEILKMTLPDGNIVLYFRYVPQSPTVPLAPVFLSGTEMAGVVLSVIIAGILAFYVSAMKPIEEMKEQEELTHVAQVIFNKPVKEAYTPPPTPPTPPPPEKTPPPPPKPPEKAKVAEEKREQQVKGAPTDKQKAAQASTAARASEVAPIPNSQNRPKKFTSTKQGGAIKIGQQAGANAQSATKDVSKIGLFSAFGGGGVRSKLDQAYSGAGGILGQAEKASGSSGFNENREGDDLGSRFKDTGAGGKGTATQGIAGVVTKGRSSGMAAYGSLDGFGDKSSVKIEAGGSDEYIPGTIDKEAVRRRIRHNLDLIRGCYVQELSKLDRAGQKSFEGRVLLTWEIVANGVAKNVKVKNSSLNNGNVEKCVAERLASISFPDPPEGMVAEVAYPFFFKAGQ